MAIYHLRATMISRSAGRSATAAAAYRSASHIEDHRTGLSFDYRARGGVDHVEILAPAHAPEWTQDRAALWNAVEAAETRKNSQVAREIRVALPAELDHGQRVELVRDFCQRQFVDRGMVADIALHAPGREGDDRNHHAHILLTTREIAAEGFTTKNRDWNAVEVLDGWREAWAQDANLALELAGHGERIDHRTLEAQRIEALELAHLAQERGHEAEALEHTVRAVALDRPPLPQLSVGAWQLKERGQEVAAVRVWHEVKAHAAEVARVAQELAGHVRTWLERAADHALDRLPPSASGLAYEGGGHERDRPQDDLAARMREAWALRDAQSGIGGKRSTISEEISDKPETPPQSLADRLRLAARGIDSADLADRAAALQRDRETEREHEAQEVERLHAEELEQEQLREKESEARHGDKGIVME
ncbi:MobQ family relaxase [Natronohydrobacter thiooxidans]|uniref:MobQ family relaxase n=1 Tax=Natronohydrobacter thiooxidans TaxID=87172 RepID=UPI0008FF0648|nr:MobQ family relaxase [Natronohydrobacter thiooxidans]